MNWWQQPFFQVALPIIITFAIATWYQSKRIDDLRDSLNGRIDELRDSLNRRIDGLDNRLDAIDRRLERIENLLTDHARRITVLEERTSPIHR
jgi:chromosome segregation ATPase